MGARELLRSDNFHRQKHREDSDNSHERNSFRELKALKQDAGPKDFVFSNARTGVNIASIKTGWRNACEDAGLLNLRFHDTRQTFATRLRANGVYEWDIRDYLVTRQ